jgi:hypothetical protein
MVKIFKNCHYTVFTDRQGALIIHLICDDRRVSVHQPGWCRQALLNCSAMATYTAACHCVLLLHQLLYSVLPIVAQYTHTHKCFTAHFKQTFVMTSRFLKLKPRTGPGNDWLRAGRSGDRIPVRARFFAPFQTGPGAHPASCTMGTGSFPGVASGRVVTLAPHPLLVPRSENRLGLHLYSP